MYKEGGDIQVQTYLMNIATVRLAAALTGQTLVDNYAFHGSLPRMLNEELGVITDNENIPDVPAKAESFRFGQQVGRALARHTASWDEAQVLAGEAAVARGMLLQPGTNPAALDTPQMRNSLQTVLLALLKRAQIRTHTAKPGGEDINAWLADYYQLQQQHKAAITALVDTMAAPGAVAAAQMDAFFDPADAMIALALRAMEVGKAPAPEALASAAGAKASCTLGVILREAV